MAKTNEQIYAADARDYLPVFARYKIVLDHGEGVYDHVRRYGLDAERVPDERHDDDDFQVGGRYHRHEGQKRKPHEEDYQEKWVGLEHGG